MRHALPRRLFLSISKNISSQDPTWALFYANEYLEKENPLRMALVEKAKSQSIHHSLFIAACEGKRVTELTEQEQGVVRQSRSTLERRTRTIPSPRARKTLHRSMRNIQIAING